ncbi:DUF6332 family protein [Actinacidiphila sp. ITFR-21]|uniref:DUF6332 family protein n=1 Tax=Actinacidiphila sp. ITFR-21 TaxID=3075199 RepID=UPI00288C34B5|nr:DUF6332 family protein [Streptomyces sp. ITFR-21]WNI19268.1 DUF6332 family protein [Streptomyces sp. ITFR-21]
MRRVRTQQEQDAVTVETVYAVVTGALFAAMAFAAAISPVLADAAHGTAREGCFTGAVVASAAIFCWRVALTLRRFERQNRLPRADVSAGRPSRPGRTRQDS